MCFTNENFNCQKRDGVRCKYNLTPFEEKWNEVQTSDVKFGLTGPAPGPAGFLLGLT